jgi:heme/copper-type cytochrome/quinol oxidase subunit 4
MEFYEYIKPELLILIPVMYFIGVAIKKSSVKDEHIPFILGITSTLLCVIWVMANTDTCNIKAIFTAAFTAVTQGILIAGASVYINQIYKQSKKDEGDNKK